MNKEKLSSEQVPFELSEWLQSMGCYKEIIPPVEKISLICRGQYYMVWRSFMEHIQLKEIIHPRKLQVFRDDIAKCKKRSPFSERNQCVVEPLELTLWKQQVEVRNKMADTEKRVKNVVHDLNVVLDKTSSKLAQRNLLQQKFTDSQRRTWLLQQIHEYLECQTKNLNETKNIADSLCFIGAEEDVQNILQKYMLLLEKNSTSQQARNRSAMSTHQSELEETLLSLVKCRGDALWAQLYQKRTALVSQLVNVNTKHEGNVVKNKPPVQSLLAHTAAIHSSLVLASIKNRLLAKQTRSKLGASLETLDKHLTSQSCELLVVLSERAKLKARLNTLKTLLDELTSRYGAFKAHGDDTIGDTRTTKRRIVDIVKDIGSTKQDMKITLACLAKTERRIVNVKECLLALFAGFHDGSALEDRFKDVQEDFPLESISSLLKLFTDRRDKERNKTDLSMNFDTSDTLCVDETNPKFSDELRVYLKKFNLEKNRKIVLDSGGKIWNFETLQACLTRFWQIWLQRGLTPVVCPSSNLTHNVSRIIHRAQLRDQLSDLLEGIRVGETSNVVIVSDVADEIEAEEKNIDDIKKQIAENIAVLQRTKNNIIILQENYKFWFNNEMKRFVSPNRTVNGYTYRECEDFFTEAINL